MQQPAARYSFATRGSFPGGPVTCAACGCRLQESGSGEAAWYHFTPLGGRDARGCRVACVELPHDALGQAIELSVA
jgi:hypothetical protein